MRKLIPLTINSFKEIFRQPFYHVILFSGCFITLLSFAFTFFSFGEEMRMIRDMGLSTITICGLLTACMSSSILIAREFERQTTHALLSKPITRTHFILGKYLGIILATFILVFSQGLVFEIALAVNKYILVSNKEIIGPAAQNISYIDYYCIMGIYFTLLQILILTAVSMILSIYFNVTGNLVLCFVIFIFCHIFSYILPFHNQYSFAVNILVTFCYIIFPNYHNLNITITNDIASESTPIYILYNSIYCFIYAAIMIWLAVILFRKRELA